MVLRVFGEMKDLGRRNCEKCTGSVGLLQTEVLFWLYDKNNFSTQASRDQHARNMVVRLPTKHSLAPTKLIVSMYRRKQERLNVSATLLLLLIVSDLLNVNEKYLSQ